jgi:hypothetical protein
MAPDYDAFFRRFKKSREFPFRTCIEAFMILQMLGNITGLTALELACGTRLGRSWASSMVIDGDTARTPSAHGP